MFEEIGVFYRGLVLGLMISAPVGPIGLLCIRRTISRGLTIGLFTGLGAACADTIFGAVAAFSVSAIVEFLQHYTPVIRVIGGVFMLAMAWRTWHDKPGEPPRITDDNGVPCGVPQGLGAGEVARIVGALVSSFVITMTNPISILATLAVVATFSELRSTADAVTIVSGIFCGSVAWWAMLSGGVALLRGFFTEKRVMLINRITAVALAILAVWAGVTGAHLFYKNI